MDFLAELFVLVCVVALGVYVYVKVWCYSHFKKKGIPYVEPSFPFGNVGSPFTRKEHPGFILKQLYDKYKKEGHKIGGFYALVQPVLLPVDPEVVKSILTKHFHQFSDRGIYYNEKAENLSGHLFFIKGDKWKKMRVKLTPTFTSGKMKMMFNIITECANPLLETIGKCTTEDKPIEVKELMGCFTTDVIGSCAFGLECNSFKNEEAAFRKYGKRVFQQSPLRWLKVLTAIVFPNMATKLGIAVLDRDVSDFFNNVVKDTVEYREKNNYQRNDFMQLLINLKNSDEYGNEGLTMEELAAQAFVFFAAGFETSSSAISFGLYELSVNRDVQKRAREEVWEVLKKHGGKMTYEGLQEMKYLGQVFDETLRKYPALPILHRKCTQDCEIEEANIRIQKGQRFLFPVLGFHYDPEYFPNPEKFDPDRFSDENKGNIKQHVYLPFGEGPRNCIGSRFGIMQSKIGLALLLKDFEFSLNQKTKSPLKMNPTGLTLSPEGGIWLNVKKVY